MNIKNGAKKSPFSGDLDCFVPHIKDYCVENVFETMCPVMWDYLLTLGKKAISKERNDLYAYFAMCSYLICIYDEKGREGLREAETQWIESHSEQLPEQK